jgi:ureidoglycolate lyase
MIPARIPALLLLLVPCLALAAEKPGKEDDAAVALLAPAPASGTVEVVPEPLTAAAFKPFGEVIEVPEGQKATKDTGAVRFWGGLAKARIAEEIEFGMFTAAARPHEVAELGRHARSPAFLVGLSGEWLLAVGPPFLAGRHPQARRVRIFVVKPGQAVLLHKGTWHADPFPKGETGLFLVAFRDGSATKDYKTRPFKGREVVRFP